MPRNGYYYMRITGEPWETNYYDHLSLMVVDHPEGTSVFIYAAARTPASPSKD